MTGWTGVLPREVRAYRRFRATGRNGALWPTDLEGTYQDLSLETMRKTPRISRLASDHLCAAIAEAAAR